jgi:homoserine O-acetyltransferase
MRRTFIIAIALILDLVISRAFAQTSWPNQREGDFHFKDFQFGSGETLPDLRLHFTTIGTPIRNTAGEIVNAVLLLHNTSGGRQTWLSPSLANELFHQGQALDASRYFIIIPDAVGFGGSSKPSDGLRTQFPHYRYRDIVESEHRLVADGLGVRHLRLVLGISMGGMHAWMWAGMYPDLMDGVVPIASQPIGISGRNWLIRRIAIETIRNDPGWNGGNYDKNPSYYVYTAPLGFLMTESVNRIQDMAPTREAGDALYKKLIEEARRDANDQLYAIEAVMDYDPSKDIEKIKARLLAINFEDDALNPPELGVVEPSIRRIANAKLVIVPASKETHGHFTNLRAKVWKSYLADFMKELPAR